MKEPVERLPEAELDIMMVLWKAEQPLTVSEIVGILSGSGVRSWKTATAHVLLDRLCERGFADKDTSTFAHRYFPIISEEAYSTREARSFLARFCGGSVKKMVAMMIDGDGVDEEELRELRALLNGSGSTKEE